MVRECPQCHRSIPLKATFGIPVVCPACQTELHPKWWSTALCLAAGMFIGRWIAAPFRGTSWSFAAVAGLYVLLFVLAWSLLARFRIKSPPPSISK